MTSHAITAIEVAVGGRPAAAPVLSIRVASRLARPTQCEVALDGPPQDWPLGAPLRVRVDGHAEPLFDGEVTSVALTRSADGAVTTRLRGYDLLHRLRARQELRVFEDVTAADLASTLTRDLAITVVADDPGPRLARVIQHGQSDLDLLTALAARCGLHPILSGNELRLLTLAGHGEPLPLEFGRSLWEIKAEANLNRVASRCTVLGWQPQRAEPIAERATAARSGRRTALSPEAVAAELTIVDRPASSADEAAALAQAALDASAGRALTLRGTAEGDPRLWPGRRIAMTGLAPEIDGVHVLTETVHTADGAGLLTTLSTEPVTITEGPTVDGTAVTLGRVTAVHDPEGLGRVRVSLPAHGDLDVGWLGVLCPGAGKGKGFVALPDVDDTVVVALPHGEPAAGVVLGALYGTITPPDPGVEGHAVRRWSMRTPGGQSLVADDDKRTLRLGNDDGSYLELAPDKVVLHAKADLTIEAPGRGITVRAASVDFDWAPVV